MFRRLAVLQNSRPPKHSATAVKKRASWGDLPEELRLRILGEAVLNPIDRMRIGAVDRATRATVQPSVPSGPALPKHPCRMTAAACRKHFAARIAEQARFETSPELRWSAPKGCAFSPCSLFLFERSCNDQTWSRLKLFDKAYHFDLCLAYVEAGDLGMLRLLYLSDKEDHIASNQESYQTLRARLHRNVRFLLDLESRPLRRPLSGWDQCIVSISFASPWAGAEREYDRRNVVLFRICADAPRRRVETLMSLTREGGPEDVKMALDEGYPCPSKCAPNEFMNGTGQSFPGDQMLPATQPRHPCRPRESSARHSTGRKWKPFCSLPARNRTSTCSAARGR